MGSRPVDSRANYRSIRERAEARLARLKPEQLEAVPEEVRRLMHELSVHQVELEMQNEELRQAQANLEVVRSRYFDLFYQAPIGYFMLGANGKLLECNRTGATMLGGEPNRLTGRKLTDFIVPGHLHTFAECRDRLFSTGEPQQLELALLQVTGRTSWAQVVMNTTVSESEGPTMRVTMTDITERKRLEEDTARLAAVVTWSDQPAGAVGRDLLLEPGCRAALWLRGRADHR